MSLYESWMDKAFNQEGKSVDAIWDDYLPKEQRIYEYMIGEKVDKLEGTVASLAQRFQMTAEQVVAFVDGINGALPTPFVMEDMTEETEISMVLDYERLFKKMVEYKAEHLYNLPEWSRIYDEEARKKMMLEQKNSRTIVKGEKIGRNDPCPCGSGKKYKKCCGVSA